MTTRLSLSGLILAAAMSAGLPALAETTPGRGAHDSRVRIATWVDGQVFRVVTSLTRVTTVEFGEGETIRSIIAGDTVGFYFHVVEARETPHYVVQFRYPESRNAPRQAVAAAAPNANYGASEQREFTPLSVWDDGTFTYFRFARNAPVPAIFRHTNGAERSVNSQAQADGVIRVSGVNSEWVLRLGDEVVCIQDLGHRGAGA